MDVIAHRGARLLAVENTAEAIRIAWQEGADAVEVDLQLSADGEVFVFHDDTMAAWNGDKRPVVSRNWRDLRAARLVDSAGRSGVVAHLDEVMELLQLGQGWCNFELKVAAGVEGMAERLAEAVAARLLDDGSAVVSSFSKRALSRFAQARPTVSTAILVHTNPQWPWSPLAAVNGRGFAADMGATAAELGNAWQAVHCNAGLFDAERVGAWRAHGLKTRPWVMNTPRQWVQCLKLEIDGAFTDDPGKMRRFLEQNQ